MSFIYTIKKALNIEGVEPLLDDKQRELLLGQIVIVKDSLNLIRERLQIISSDTTKYLDNLKEYAFPDFEHSDRNPAVIFSSMCTTTVDIQIQKIDLFMTEVILPLENSINTGCY